jgi:hypothetical protein
MFLSGDQQPNDDAADQSSVEGQGHPQEERADFQLGAKLDDGDSSTLLRWQENVLLFVQSL